MSSASRFADRVVLVTGAAGGIGKAAAGRFAAEGAQVVITDIDEPRLQATADELGADRVAADVTNEDDVRRVVAYVVQQHGKVDVLTNVAGIYPFRRTEEETLAGWRQVMSTNLESVFLFSKEVLPHMRERGYGRIVNTSSSTVHLALPGLPAYVASKAGIVGFSRVLAREAGPHGITANALLPGLTATEQVLRTFDDDAAIRAFLQEGIDGQAIKRSGTPVDIASGITFLAAEEAGFITGQVLMVDGGWAFTG